MAPKLLLPTEAIPPAQWEPWWTASVAYVTEDDVRGCSVEEHAFVDQLIDRGTTALGVLDRELASAMFRVREGGSSPPPPVALQRLPRIAALLAE